MDLGRGRDIALCICSRRLCPLTGVLADAVLPDWHCHGAAPRAPAPPAADGPCSRVGGHARRPYRRAPSAQRNADHRGHDDTEIAMMDRNPSQGSGTSRHVMQVVYALSAGGSEMLAAAIARAGVAQGMRMSICAMQQGGALEPSLRAAGVSTHVIARPPGFQPKVLARMYRLFRREGTAVVVTHHLSHLLYSAIGARLAGSRLLHVEHEYYTLASARARRRLLIAARLAERVVAVSEGVAEFLVRGVGLSPSKVVMIRNGVDVERFAPPTGRERAVLEIPPEVPVLGTVGRLDPVKDHGTLLAAFRLVLEAFPKAILVIIGDGEMRPELEAFVGRHGLRRN